jgi:uncharacterized membrane protein YjfL (UPF0719 family)
MMQVLEKVSATIGWSFVGVVILYSAMRLFDILDPVDYRDEIRKGNMAAGLIMGAIVLATAAIIISILLLP